MQEKKTIAPEQLHEIIRRIVEVAQPEKIILFGSAARGEMGPHSDVDLLVIKSGAHRLELTGQIYRHMHGVGAAVDIIVVTPEDVERYHHEAQQAAEKAIKALLIKQEVAFPYVHDLARLLTVLEEAEETIPDTIRDA